MDRPALSALTWLGHATVLLEYGDGTRVLTDPVLRNRVGPLRRIGPVPRVDQYDRLDAVVLSHLHHDHLDLPSLRRIGPGVPVVAPAGSTTLFDARSTVREVSPGDRLGVGGLDVAVTTARHEGDRLASKVHGPAVGYLIGRTWFAGDTGRCAEHDELAGRVDVALVPIGGWGLTLGPGHLDPRQAAGLVAAIRPRLVVPIHWGTLFLRGAWHLDHRRSRDAGRIFAHWAGQLAPATEVAVLGPGERITMP